MCVWVVGGLKLGFDRVAVWERMWIVEVVGWARPKQTSRHTAHTAHSIQHTAKRTRFLDQRVQGGLLVPPLLSRHLGQERGGAPAAQPGVCGGAVQGLRFGGGCGVAWWWLVAVMASSF